MTVAVTVFALLELYKRGEAEWQQEEPFGEITVRSEAPPRPARRRRGAARRRLADGAVVTGLARLIEALLFLAPEPVPVEELADALQCSEDDVTEALGELRHALGGRGVVLREVGGGFALASHPDAEEAARRLLARPRTPSLTPAQAETLSIVAYLQPVSRPEVARIRGVASESAAAALTDRGLIEESGRSQFGAVLYRTTPLFLKLFGLKSVDDLPDPVRVGPAARRTRRRCATACCAPARSARRSPARAAPRANP